MADPTPQNSRTLADDPELVWNGEGWGHVDDGFNPPQERCGPDCTLEVVRPGSYQCPSDGTPPCEMPESASTLGYCLDATCRIGFQGAGPCDTCKSTGDTVVSEWTLADVADELLRPKSHRAWGLGLLWPVLGLDPDMTVDELARRLAIAERVIGENPADTELHHYYLTGDQHGHPTRRPA